MRTSSSRMRSRKACSRLVQRRSRWRRRLRSSGGCALVRAGSAPRRGRSTGSHPAGGGAARPRVPRPRVEARTARRSSQRTAHRDAGRGGERNRGGAWLGRGVGGDACAAGDPGRGGFSGADAIPRAPPRPRRRTRRGRPDRDLRSRDGCGAHLARSSLATARCSSAVSSVPGAEKVLHHDYPLTPGIARRTRLRLYPTSSSSPAGARSPPRRHSPGAALRRVPYVLVVESHDEGPRAGWRRAVKGVVVPRVVRGASGVLVTGTLARRSMVARGAAPERVHVFANTIDVEAFGARVDRLARKPDGSPREPRRRPRGRGRPLGRPAGTGEGARRARPRRRGGARAPDPARRRRRRPRAGAARRSGGRERTSGSC